MCARLCACVRVFVCFERERKKGAEGEYMNSYKSAQKSYTGKYIQQPWNKKTTYINTWYYTSVITFCVSRVLLLGRRTTNDAANQTDQSVNEKQAESLRILAGVTTCDLPTYQLMLFIGRFYRSQDRKCSRNTWPVRQILPWKWHDLKKIFLLISSPAGLRVYLSHVSCHETSDPLFPGSPH